jgi:arginine/lysine/ornithine decarboxylase
VERAFGLHPDAAAVLITSPLLRRLSDIAGIAKECGKKKAVLIVDEAHGAHLAFSGLLPGGALSAGADIVVQSGHKTLPVFTPGAYLHFNMEADDGRVLETMLACGSSSPSYLVAASLDFARAYMEQNGAENIRLIVENNRNISNSIE